MIYQKIKDLFNSSVEHVASDISQYSYHPDKDFSRNRKISPALLISYFVLQGSSSLKNEMLDFWGLDPAMPTASALIQQRSKLKSDALEAVFKQFNSAAATLDNTALSGSDYRFLAADGSNLTYFSTPAFSSDEYYSPSSKSPKGVYSMHLNAFFDLNTHTYTDAIIQAVHNTNEFSAFCDMVDRHSITDGIKNVYIGDRGYCSYNTMAHVINQGQYFLFRTKDIHSKGLIGNFEFPDEESFDIRAKVTLVRSHSRKVVPTPGNYVRFINQSSAFDFIEYGSYETYDMEFRIVRFPISDSTYECIVTNLPENEFPPSRIKTTYFSRWGIESSFRKLKHTIGLINFHSYKPEFIKQEIWGALIAYNITETMIHHTVLEERKTKYCYKVDFTKAAHICRAFLRLATEKDQKDIAQLLQRELIPIRNGRQYSRLQTARFRRPRYFAYRAA